MAKPTMTGEVRAALKVAFGDKVQPRMVYNDWVGRQTMPNKRDIKMQSSVRKRCTKAEQATFKRSLQQRMAQFGLKVHEVIFGNPYTFRHMPGMNPKGDTYAGSIYITLHEV